MRCLFICQLIIVWIIILWTDSSMVANLVVVLLSLGQLTNKLVFQTQELEVSLLELFLKTLWKLDVGQSIRLWVINVGKPSGFTLIHVEYDKVLLHDIVHHLDFAFRVPNLLLDPNQKGLWRF